MSKVLLDGLHYKQHEMNIPDKSIDDKCPYNKKSTYHEIDIFQTRMEQSSSPA